MTTWEPIEDCWFLTGATASGKTAIGLELARSIDAEIISLDSMAVYRGMDVGTAKPTAAERAEIPHHLIDVVDPSHEFSVAEYVAAAHATVADIKARGRQALFVGGTPLYLKALLRGLFPGPAADWEFRTELLAAAETFGPTYLHARLQQVDPAAAARLHANDTRRLIRALEVHERSGQPISQLQQQFDRARPASACRVFVLQWPRETLYARIERRVDAMFDAGLVAETAGLVGEGKQLSRAASQALGYREVLEHLAGRYGLEETRALVKTRTRQFAKRQSTWFRSLSECRDVDLSEPVDAHRVGAAITLAGKQPVAPSD